MQTGYKRRRTNGSGSNEILRSKRHLPPAHYSLKVRPFSLLSEAEKYESRVFEAGGHTWRLVLYPNGDEESKGEDYVSLYLELAESGSFPGLHREVNVNFKLFVHDQVEDKYLTIQFHDAKRFHKMKTKWGFAQLLPLGTFKDPSNGYLVDDTCVFGAEVFVIKNTGNWEFLSLISSPDIADATFTWKIEKFFLLDKETFSKSEKFIVGGKKWNLMIYPNGEKGFKGKAVSLYLMPSDWEDINTNAAVYAEYKLRLLDQLNGKHHESSASTCFGASDGQRGWGYQEFISLEDLLKPSNGFIVNDSLIVEVEFIVVSESKILVFR